MKRVLIVGANSAIAEALARLLAARGDSLYLLARSSERLEALASDLRLRGASACAWGRLDADELAAHPAALEAAWKALGGVDAALIAHGRLSDEAACAASPEASLAELKTNALSVISLACLLAGRLEAQGGGSLAVIGSVAGDRGRASNLIYGTSKAAVAAYFSGLRQRLRRSGVHVLTVKPGFVDTPMTAHLAKSPLFASPQSVARGILRALDRKKDVVYLPGFWRPVMALIRALPESLFKRLSF